MDCLKTRSWFSFKKRSGLLVKVILAFLLVVPVSFQTTFALPLSAEQAQQKTISGKVSDKDGISLPGVSVIVKGTTTGVVTDSDGKYTLAGLPTTAKVLVFNFVGMKRIEIVIANQTAIDVTMLDLSVDLEEVVAVGYASQKRANVVGSVTSVSGDAIQSIPAADVTNAISGRLPGSIVMQQSGEPGNNQAKILIRGRTTLGGNTGPLIVIDGIPGRELSEVDPIDISSISVLKDAAAAIYGASAANGVILVTTKRGQEGLPRLNYQFFQGFMSPTIVPKTANAGDYSTMLSEYQTYENRQRTYSDKDIELYKSHADPWGHPDTDWYGDLIKDWTTTSKHNLTLDGGFKGLYYYVSLGMKGDEGIYKQSSTRYQQYNMRAKIEVPITKWLKTSLDIAGFQTERRYPAKNADAIVGQSTRLVPTQWSFWPDGKPGPDIEYGDNPVVTSTLQTGTDDQKFYKVQNTFKVTITPPFVKGLIIDAFYSYDIDNEYHKRFVKPWILNYPNWDNAVRDATTGYVTSMETIPTPRGVASPELNEWYSRSTSKLSNVSLTYSKKIGEHDFTVFGAYEQLQDDWNYFGAFRKYYISDVVQTIDAGADKDKNNSGTMAIYARRSLIGRATYSYKSKYLAEVLFRRDGSLKFPTDNRWGNFPGLLVGWRASEEKFWKNNLSFINYFKLRASYGEMGMDPGSPFQYMNKYRLDKGMTFGTDKTVETTVTQAGVANPFITWEKQKSANIGFDSKLFNDMFHLNAEFFQNKREDILTTRNASVPYFTGLALPDENIARVDNKGFEFDAGYHKKISDDFKFDLTGNVSWNHNEVVFNDEPERSVAWQRTTGHPYGAQLMYNSLGIFADQAAVNAYPHIDGAKPGDVIFEDYNADKKIDADDRILIDKTDAPEIFYGVSMDLTYKNFTVSLLAQGQGSFYVRNNQDGRRGEAGNYFQWQVDNRWTSTNTKTDVARAFNRDDQYWAMDRNMSTYWLSNMAYCRLKNAVINYNIPSKYFTGTGVTRASIYFSGNNLFLIYSAQKNFDPEIANPMRYPAMTTYAIGARITF